jgi:serine beta-lactamase-like protein LACTB
MKRSVFASVAFAFITLSVSPGRGQTNALEIRAYLEQIRSETGAPGVSAAVGLRGEIVFSEGVGFAEFDNHTASTGATVHNVGSISKVMTTVAIMQLVEKGKVRLDDRIQVYVPSFPEKEAPITIQHILTHSSGIRHYRDGEFGPDGLLEMKRWGSIEDAIQIFAKDPLLFRPGALWSYSSHAFNLLQGVIEKASNMGFETYLRLHLWEPAGMLASAFDVPERIVNGRGRGYERNRAGTLQSSPYVDVSYKYASGGMLSTVTDLVRFGMALNHGVLLKPETVSRMYAVVIDPVIAFREGAEPEPANFKQALGRRVETDVSGRRFVSHSGTVRGTRSILVNYPEQDLVVALQANIVPFDSPRFGKAIAQEFLPSAHPTISSPAKPSR